jgi:hypothetical protein
MSFILGFILGFFTFIAYLSFRALRSSSWDSSNLFNVLRVIAFLATHPRVFPYLRDTTVPDSGSFKNKYPFWYLPYDEFKKVVK